MSTSAAGGLFSSGSEGGEASTAAAAVPWHRVQHLDDARPQSSNNTSTANDDDDEDEDDQDEWEYTEEEELITLDLGPLGNRLIRPGIECSLINLDTDSPYLRVGDRIFRGHWTQPLGTDIHLSVVKDTSRPPQQQNVVSPVLNQAPLPSVSNRRLILRPIVPPTASPSAEDRQAQGTAVTTEQAQAPSTSMNGSASVSARTLPSGRSADVSTSATDAPPLQLELAASAIDVLRRLTACTDIISHEGLATQLKEIKDGGGVKEPVIVDHNVLVQVSQRAQRIGSSLLDYDLDPPQVSLYALTRGARLYFPPKPKFERSPELEKSLAAIRLAQEREEYERMSSMRNPSDRKRSLFSLAEPPQPHSTSASDNAGLRLTVQKLTPEQEAAEWEEANKQISAVINVVISMAAVATAAWWAAGSASVIWKTLVCIVLAIVVGVAETVMYARYWRVSTQQARVRKAKMTGFDAGKPPELLSLGGT